MAVVVTRKIASRGFSIFGSSTLSTLTCFGVWKTRAFMLTLAFDGGHPIQRIGRATQRRQNNTTRAAWNAHLVACRCCCVRHDDACLPRVRKRRLSMRIEPAKPATQLSVGSSDVLERS